MKRKIRVAILGAAGHTAQVCIKYLVERGAEVVLGIGNKNNLGVDLGTLSGIDPIGVVLSPRTEIDRLLKETKPDVAIDCTYNEMENVYPNVKACLENGVSVVAVGVFCYYPWFNSPEVSAELDEIAKKNNCSFLGSSSGDLWQNLPAVLSAGSGNIKRIKVGFHALMDEFGEMVAREMGVGTPPEEWDKLHGEDERSPWEPVVVLLAEQLGYTVKDTKFEQVSLGAPEDIEHKKLGMYIPKGYYIGRDEYMTVYTEEGVEILAICHTKIAGKHETGSYEIEIEGEPNLSMKVDDFNGDILTSTIMVNRVPDMIYAPKGVITVNDLPVPAFRGEKLFEIEEADL